MAQNQFSGTKKLGHLRLERRFDLVLLMGIYVISGLEAHILFSDNVARQQVISLYSFLVLSYNLWFDKGISV